MGKPALPVMSFGPLTYVDEKNRTKQPLSVGVTVDTGVCGLHFVCACVHISVNLFIFMKCAVELFPTGSLIN